MPSTIGTAVGGADAGVLVGANYLKAKPSTKFATRDLAFLIVDMDNSSYFNNHLNSDSNFSKVVRAVQLQTEVFAVGTPSNGVVTFVVAMDTANDGANIDEQQGNPAQYNSAAKTISEALDAVGINADVVSFNRLVGSSFTSMSSADKQGYNPDGSTYVD